MRSNYQFRPNTQLDTIIFDLDDTLISWANPQIEWRDYLKPFFESMEGYLTRQGYHIDGSALAISFGRNTRDAWADTRNHEKHIAVSMGGVLYRVLTELGLDADEIDIDQLMRCADWRPFPGVDLYPDTHAVLDELRERGYKIGLITNAFQPMWMRDKELAHYALIDRLDARITSGDTGFMKPHPAIFWRMLGLLDSEPDRAMYVGDSPAHDVRGANETGLISVHIDPPHLDKKPESPIETANYTISALTDLLTIVENLSS
jgi:putative hydrolase of the HAD superfamily